MVFKSIGYLFCEPILFTVPFLNKKVYQLFFIKGFVISNNSSFVESLCEIAF